MSLTSIFMLQTGPYERCLLLILFAGVQSESEIVPVEPGDSIVLQCPGPGERLALQCPGPEAYLILQRPNPAPGVLQCPFLSNRSSSLRTLFISCGSLRKELRQNFFRQNCEANTLPLRHIEIGSSNNKHKNKQAVRQGVTGTHTRLNSPTPLHRTVKVMT